MTSLMGHRGYFPNQQQKFSPNQRQVTNPVQGRLPVRPLPVQQRVHTPVTPVAQPIAQPTPIPTPLLQKQIPLSAKSAACLHSSVV